MKKNSFVKNLMMHIRYPWTALCLLILWIGLAIMGMILQLTINEIIIVICAAGAATLAIAVIGFRG